MEVGGNNDGGNSCIPNYNGEENNNDEYSLIEECSELQRQELEALKFIYTLEKELIIINEKEKEKDIVVKINIKDENYNNNIKYCFELPKTYPLKSLLIFSAEVENYTDEMNNYLNAQIYKYMQTNCQQQSILNLVCEMNQLLENIESAKKTKEVLTNYSEEEEEEEEEKEKEQEEKVKNVQSFIYYNMCKPIQPIKTVLGRRLCYSHHILNIGKRSLIIKWARELGIGGYSKIGYPGIIVCEGRKEEVDFYVMSLNKLRWKHFDCRGMEDIVLEEHETINDKRVLPRTMTEIDPKGMSTLSDICAQCGLRDLFLTSMKIYHPKEKEKAKGKGKVKGKEKEKGADESEGESENKQKKKQKQKHKR